MGKRYRSSNEWVRSYLPIPDGPCAIDVCDAIETYSDGRDVRWTDGVYRVRFLRKVDGFRGKTFIGEMAWADAERLAHDSNMACLRQGR